MAQPKKKATKKTKAVKLNEAPAPRRLQQPSYRSFRLHKRIRPPQPKLSSSWALWKRTLATFEKNYRVLIPIILVYFAAVLLFVRGLSGGIDIQGFKESFSEFYSGSLSSLLTAGALFGTLVGTAGGSSSSGGQFMQTALLVIATLSTVWALRQLAAGEKITFKDAFYKGAYPLIPFLIVLIIVCLQLVPLIVGNWLFSVTIASGIAVTEVEKILWGLLCVLLALLSFYMVTSSIFALLIVTLPDMTPIKAIRSARQLVLHRRWVVMRKLLLLPLGILVVGIIVMFPVLLFVPKISEWLFMVVSSGAWIFSVTYVYNLYRELLHE